MVLQQTLSCKKKQSEFYMTHNDMLVNLYLYLRGIQDTSRLYAKCKLRFAGKFLTKHF